MSSNKYQFVSENSYKILEVISNNQNILRYITYLDNNPLSTKHNNIINENIIWSSSSDIKNKDDARIFLDVFDDDLSYEDKIRLFLSPIGSEDIYISDVSTGGFLYMLSIVVPNSSWCLINNQLRVYNIAHEIAKEIDGKEIAGIGSVKIKSDRVEKTNNGYRVLKLQIRVENVVFANG